MIPDAASSSGPAPGADLQRLDWRFLLGLPWPRRVAWIGPEPPASLRALADVEVLSAAEVGRAGGCEVVIASGPTDAQIEQAAKCLAPGGSLIVEVHARSGPEGTTSPRRRTSLGAVTRKLHDLGLTNVRRHWHWPDLERCTRMVPLRDRGPVLDVLARTGGGLRGKFQRRAVRALLDLGILDRFTVGSVIASKPPATPASTTTQGCVTPDSFVHRFFMERVGIGNALAHGVGPRSPFVALTPRFRNSSHLVFLLSPEVGGEPVVAVKLARRTGASPGLQEEADRLAAVHSLRPGGFDSIPRVIACEVFEGHALLAETALAGRAMDPGRVRADTAGCCDAIVDWLLEVQKGSRRAHGAGEPWIASRIERDLAVLQAAGLIDTGLAESALHTVRTLSSHPIPSVLEHGDLSHPNILLRSSGTAAVLDWELSDSSGLPAADLFFFLAYVARARAQVMTGPSAAAAIVDAFAGAADWLRAPLARYRAEIAIPPPALPGLFVACWATQAAGVVRRLPPGAAVSSQTTELRSDWRIEVFRRVALDPSRFLTSV